MDDDLTTDEPGPDDLAERAGITISSAASAFIQERGGSLYIWTDAAGLLQSRTRPPSEFLQWSDVRVKGVGIRIAPGLDWVRYWRIEFRRFPLKHVEVATSESPPPISLLDQVSWIPW